MTFHILDPLGFLPNYEVGNDWRQVSRREAVSPLESNDKKQEKPPHKKKKKKQEGSSKDNEDAMLQVFSTGRSPLVASQVMTEHVTTLSSHSPILEAINLVLNKRFRHIPIVNEDGQVVGIVSDRRVMQEIIEKSIDYKDEERLMRDIMVNKVLSTGPMTEIAYIASIFVRERIGSMPIINPEGQLIGIITRSDLLRTLTRITPPEIRV